MTGDGLLLGRNPRRDDTEDMREQVLRVIVTPDVPTYVTAEPAIRGLSVTSC